MIALDGIWSVIRPTIRPAPPWAYFREARFAPTQLELPHAPHIQCAACQRRPPSLYCQVVRTCLQHVQLASDRSDSLHLRLIQSSLASYVPGRMSQEWRDGSQLLLIACGYTKYSCQGRLWECASWSECHTNSDRYIRQFRRQVLPRSSITLTYATIPSWKNKKWFHFACQMSKAKPSACTGHTSLLIVRKASFIHFTYGHRPSPCQ
ncbi:hypothetical protein OG21DRAFT_821972 [Imleria badia]|nr:hypothetical protein OG21DRAFT_821972 [Imleria badia]